MDVRAAGAEREREHARARGAVAAAGSETAEARDGQGQRERRQEGSEVQGAPRAPARCSEERTEGHEKHREPAGRVEQRGRRRRDGRRVEQRPPEVSAERTEAEAEGEPVRGLGAWQRCARPPERNGEGGDECRGLECRARAHAAPRSGASPRAHAVAATWAAEKNR